MARNARLIGLLAGVLLLWLCGAAAADEVIEAWTMPVLARHALEGGHTMTVYEDPAVGVLCYVLDRDKAMSCVPAGATNYVSEIKVDAVDVVDMQSPPGSEPRGF